ncbi:MAG TPA: ROK family transcriptional regulator [Thermomicrobiales bacterium]|nr:ROK family transcriptional regulator [Thermomicrobiales bacterium]
MVLPGGIVNSRRRIIDLLVAHGALSRADLARETRLSKPTISTIVAELVADGIVVEIGPGASTGGRKPILLRLGGTRRLVASVELDATTCRFLLVTLDGERLALHEQAAPAELADLPDAIARGLDHLFVGWNRPGLVGCGVAVAGLLDLARDTVDFATRHDWRHVPLRAQLAQRLGVPVLITDRGKAAGLGELWSLGREKRDDLIYLYLGRGVAGAIVLGSAIHLGPSHTAGEIGHMVVNPAGPPCDCGRQGCLEALVSTGAMLAHARALAAEQAGPLAGQLRDAGDDEALAAIGSAAAANEALALAVVDYAARWLGLAIANLINVLNPAVVVLGGPLAQWGAPLVAALNRQLDRQALPVPRQAVRIVTSQAGDLAAPLGAAALVLQRAGEFLARTELQGPSEVESRKVEGRRSLVMRQ